MLQGKAQAAPMLTQAATITSKLYLTPKSLPELFKVLEQFAKQQDDFRLIAGNTGAGVYHDWPSERVLIDIKGIPDLSKIETSKVWHALKPWRRMSSCSVAQLYVTACSQDTDSMGVSPAAPCTIKTLKGTSHMVPSK